MRATFNLVVQKFKTIYSKQMWRLRQSQTIINMMFFSLTLAGVYSPYASALIDMPKYFLLPLLALISLLLLWSLGVIYDNVLNLWKEDSRITNKRNPYAIDEFYQKEIEVMKMGYVFNKGTCANLKTNIQIGEKLGLDVRSAKKELKNFEEKLKIYEQWIKEGRIQSRI